MAFRIGFAAEQPESKPVKVTYTVPQEPTAPRKSVVQVYFADSNRKLAYYNDQFDLHCGDFVYVDGKLEGLRGRVVEVNYNFKIKISEYKRVIAVIDTTAKRPCTTQKAPTPRSSIRKCSRWCAWRCSAARMKRSRQSATANTPASTRSAVC